LPEEVRRFLEALRLAPMGVPEKKTLPGFTAPVWLIPVHDQGTCETVRIVMGYPVAEYERYELVQITNTEGYPVTVLVPREEAVKVKPRAPPPGFVEEAAERVAREVPKPAYKAPVDWGEVEGFARKLKGWLDSCVRLAEKREALGIYSYMETIQDLGGGVRDVLMSAAAEIWGVRERPPVAAALKPEEYVKLWEEFARELREAGVNPERYRRRFEELIYWGDTYEGNRLVVLDEARNIILDEELRREGYVDTLPVEPERFSWKYVGWGLGSMRADAVRLQVAVKERDAVGAYSSVVDILDAAERLKRLLALHPDVKRFLGR